MRSLCLSLVLSLVGPLVAHADPVVLKPADEKLERPVTPQRRAAQVLGLAAIGLVVAGTVSFGVSLSQYSTVRDGCGASVSCTPDELAAGKTALAVGWSFVGAGVAAGIAAMILSATDRPARAGVALVPSLGGLALAGRY